MGAGVSSGCELEMDSVIDSIAGLGEEGGAGDDM